MSDLVANKAQITEIIMDVASKINNAGGATGGGAAPSQAVIAPISRWLRFDPTNKKGLVIKAGTYIKKKNGIYRAFKTDTHIDLTEYLTTPGKDYFLSLENDNTFTATINKTQTGVTIGRFHTLCVNAGASLSMIAPAPANSGIVVNIDKFLVKGYREDTDPDFYNLYNQTVTAVSAGTPYDVVTCNHPLAGFEAGDILPESVFCLTWYPHTLIEDAMVYDVDTDLAVDVYLQSGTGYDTRSAFGATHTANRQQGNHAADMHAVGKRLLSDDEFTSIALGSNEATNITGGADVAAVGGHVNTAGRRMVSAIGVEDACGLLWQWTRTIAQNSGSEWKTIDGRGAFGKEYSDIYVLIAGGTWNLAADCGSRGRHANIVRSFVSANIGGRGSSRVTRGL